MSKLSTMRIVPGMTVCYDSVRYHVVDLVSAMQVLIKGDDGNYQTVSAIELIPDLEQPLISLPDLGAIASDKWERAIEIYNMIDPLIAMGSKRRTRADVQKIAVIADKHISTIYRWLEDYEATGLVSSLIRKPRKDVGKKRLDERVEALITKTIEKFYLTAQVRTPAKTAYEVRKLCIQNNLSPPDASTVRNRIFEISEEYRMRRRRGGKAADERFEPIRGSFPGADFPLACQTASNTFR